MMLSTEYPVRGIRVPGTWVRGYEYQGCGYEYLCNLEINVIFCFHTTFQRKKKEGIYDIYMTW